MVTAYFWVHGLIPEVIIPDSPFQAAKANS